MSKTVGANLKAHLAQEVTTLATCLKMTLRGSPQVVLGFTDHDVAITFDGVLYEAITGQTPSEVVASNAFSVDNLEILGLISNAGISEVDLHAGVYDDAALELFMVNWADLTQGRMVLRTGNTGNLQFMQTAYIAEFRGLTQRLQQTVGDVYSYTCRATLGDAKCGVALAGYQVSGSVTSAISSTQWYDASKTQADHYWTYGVVRWTAGANVGRVSEVTNFDSGVFTVAFPLAGAVVNGDTYTVTPGCDKQPSTCKTKYNNYVNFRGEELIKGVDAVYANPPIVSETL